MFLSASCGRCTGLVIALALVPIAIWLSSNHWTLSVDDPLPFDVPTVLNGLLAAESEATVRLGSLVVIGFGGCLDHVSNGIAALKQLGANPPEDPGNVNELNNLSEMETAFAYYFKNGASAGYF
jgi:ADP-specific Phosphofructokinase/Glucokinase conserved region